MNTYNDNNPPKSGNAKKIYDAIKAMPNSPEILDLHYNPNCWGNAPERGWGTWAVTFNWGPRHDGFWCGIDDRGVYLEGTRAPYTRQYIKLKLAEEA